MWHLVRERLLATLSAFFAAVALVLAAIGLYGVLNYSVTRQRRDIGIRIALGARWSHIVAKVGRHIVAVVCGGAALGLAGGLAAGRFVESLLFEVKSTDWQMIAAPVATLAAVAVIAALPPALRAARTDPSRTLRTD